jgi:hypothetical protein
MNIERAKAERMRFLFICDPNTFAKDICGYPLRSCAMAFCIAHAALGFLIVINMETPSSLFLAFPAFWLLMLIGPYTQDIVLCVLFTLLLMIATYYFTLLSIWISVAVYLLPIIVIPVAIYLVFWYITAYIYFSYTKSIALGLLPTEANQSNSQCATFIQPNESSCEVAATSLKVEQSPTIVLTSPVDLAFVNDKHGLIVDNVTLPSGLVVPSGGHGENWKVVGNLITLV